MSCLGPAHIVLPLACRPHFQKLSQKGVWVRKKFRGDKRNGQSTRVRKAKLCGSDSTGFKKMIVCKLMRKLSYFSLDVLPQFITAYCSFWKLCSQLECSGH